MLTAYRGAMMLFTCVCILAVDFASFPRWASSGSALPPAPHTSIPQAVCQDGGVWLLAHGRRVRQHTLAPPLRAPLLCSVGLFVFSSGMFAKSTGGGQSWKVLLLGCGRLAVTTAFSYHQHVSE